MGYGTDIIENYLIEQGVDPTAPSCDEENAESIIEAMKSCYAYLLNPKIKFSGYITTKSSEKGNEEFIDFQPVKFRQIENEKLIEFDRFSLAVDHFMAKYRRKNRNRKWFKQKKRLSKS